MMPTRPVLVPTFSSLRRCTRRLPGASAPAAVVVLLAAAVTVAAQGGGTPAPVTPSPGLPLSTFATADFTGSGTCALCHSALRDSAGNDVSIDTHWRASMMANASLDPLWRAKVSAEVARNPTLAPVIEEKCATCHAPMARTQASVQGTPVRLLGDGFFDPAHTLHAAARDGVSCTLCHQVTPQGFGTADSFTGHYRIDTSTAAPNRLVFGPYAAPLLNPMRNVSGFTPAEGAHVRESGLCATCHTLYTPTVDASGAVVGQLPEQTPYLEWRHSSYGDDGGESRSCQQCHMPAAAGPVPISNRPFWIAPRTPFAQHQFVGANTFMLGVLESAVDALGLSVSTANLAAARARTETHLADRTARVSVTDAWIEDRTVTAVVSVENLAGHKFPTGFPSRRAWLHLTVTDQDGRVVFESGRPAADGSIAGNAADESAAGVEPHYTTITAAGQVQIYEAVMADTDGAATYTLLRGARYLKDNRLLPDGFDPATAHADVGVYGEARFDSNFSGGKDEVAYVVDIPPTSGALTVTARLLYQTASYRFVRDLRTTGTPEVARYAGLHDAASHEPALVAKATAAVRRP